MVRSKVKRELHGSVVGQGTSMYVSVVYVCMLFIELCCFVLKEVRAICESARKITSLRHTVLSYHKLISLTKICVLVTTYTSVRSKEY